MGSALTAGHFWQTPGMPAQPKVTKRSVPHHSAPRLGSVCPHYGQRGLTGRLRSKSKARWPESRPEWCEAEADQKRKLSFLWSLALLWELACLRWPRLGLPERTGSNCGSGLAREGGVSVATCIDWHTAFASKRAHLDCIFSGIPRCLHRRQASSHRRASDRSNGYVLDHSPRDNSCSTKSS